MANRNIPAANVKSRRPQSFSNLLSKVPTIRNFRRTTISGILFQSEQKGKFVLQTPEGHFYELDVASVEQFRVLERKDECVVIEIQVHSRELPEGQAFPKDVLTKEQFAEEMSRLPLALSGPEQAQDHLSILREDPAHPIHQYWEFDRAAESPFKDLDHPFPQSSETRS